MGNSNKPRILITGATGQVGGKTLELLLGNSDIKVIAAVRNAEKAWAMQERGIATVFLDYDEEASHLTALKNVDRILMVTGYTVDMIRQSKVFIDNAKKSNVQHIVHLGAPGANNTTVGHFAWHQLIERYIEWSGFSFTHLRPEIFMQNLLSYGGAKVVNNGIIHQYVGDAKISFVDTEDIARVATQALLNPALHGGQTYRLGYDAKTYHEVAEIMGKITGKPFQYQPQAPELFLDAVKNAGAEMTYMYCVYQHYKKYADGTIPGDDFTFDNFHQITGQKPVKWEQFITRNIGEFNY